MFIALGIVSFILIVLIQMVDATSNAWSAGTRRVDAFREARAALHIIERDLAGLKTDWYQPADLTNPEQFKSNLRGLPIVLDDADEIDGLTLQGMPKPRTQALFFLSTSADLGTSPSQRTAADGDLCTVGYYVAFANDGASGRKVYKLYRYFKPSRTTFNRVYSYLKKSAEGETTVTQENFLIDNPGTDPKGADDHEPLAFNVTDFTIKAYYYDQAGKIQVFSAEKATDPAFPQHPTRPDFLEVTLGVLGNQSVAKLPPDDPAAWERTPLGQGLPSEPTARTVAQEARVFTTRINCN